MGEHDGPDGGAGTVACRGSAGGPPACAVDGRQGGSLGTCDMALFKKVLAHAHYPPLRPLTLQEHEHLIALGLRLARVYFCLEHVHARCVWSAWIMLCGSQRQGRCGRALSGPACRCAACRGMLSWQERGLTHRARAWALDWTVPSPSRSHANPRARPAGTPTSRSCRT